MFSFRGISFSDTCEDVDSVYKLTLELLELLNSDCKVDRHHFQALIVMSMFHVVDRMIHNQHRSKYRSGSD